MKESPTPPQDQGQSSWLDEHPKANWLATSRTTGYLSAGVVGLVLVLVVVILIVGRGGEDTPTPAAPSPTAPNTSEVAPPPNSGGASGFGPSIADPFGREIAVPINQQGQILPQSDPGERAAFEKNTPVPAPAGMKWERIGATVAPFSTSDGPTRIEGRLAYGFARTPQGAALAGWQISARSLRSGADVREVYERQIIADPGVAEANLAALTAKGEADFQTGKALIFPEAFKITSYTGDFAIVQYAFPISGGGQWNVGQSSLVWTEDGWKIRISDVQIPLPQISTLNGWTRW